MWTRPVDYLADDALCRKLETGVNAEGEHLAAKRVTVLRQCEMNAWLEIVLDEGRNRHIRRLLEALGVSVLRLVRVAVGTLELGKFAERQVARTDCRRVAGFTLIHQPIPIIPLPRLVAKVGDEAFHVLDRHAERGAGAAHHVFFDHDAAQVARPILESNLADLLSLRHP